MADYNKTTNIRLIDANRDRINEMLNGGGRFRVVLDYDDIIRSIARAEAALKLAYRSSELVGTRIELAPGTTPDVNAYGYVRHGVWATITRSSRGWNLTGVQHRWLARVRTSYVHLPDGDARLAPWLSDQRYGAGSL